ncbi:MBL fold metallo-hydrolase [Caldibacillus lycopersici]|uniref:MBL fold metallo-hydrolase n=1 Tax=Perspicuibacillus lycopersici TaxID=1325689 RepID=A0AAE3IT16_9BACI|nr:MBL fold metallo-hydrolase [Perspicuibacillus lycopersici]MCU9613867.1 MBL fold metallo-hydrolase [Perspicuibacillus lycopersici]
MKWEQIPLGRVQTNCYCLSIDSKCIIIDPGAEGEKLAQILQEKGLRPIAILLTHGHFDHIGAVDFLREKYSIPVYIHKKERDWLSNSSLNASTFFFPDEPMQIKPADFEISGAGKLTIDEFSFTIFETPGHSPGSVSYYVEAVQFIVSGDALFYGGIGRTDLPGGNQQQLLSTIKETLFALPEETIVLPGHGPKTTIAREKQSNPFLRA